MCSLCDRNYHMELVTDNDTIIILMTANVVRYACLTNSPEAACTAPIQPCEAASHSGPCPIGPKIKTFSVLCCSVVEVRWPLPS